MEYVSLNKQRNHNCKTRLAQNDDQTISKIVSKTVSNIYNIR